MSDIRRFPGISHLRAEPTAHVLRYRKGQLISSVRGGSFWFRPLTSAVAEVPIDDREQSFLFNGRTSDFQDVAVQGAITYRVLDPELTARRVDFGIDHRTGTYLEEPLERISQMVAQTAQQLALDWVAHRNLDEVLREAVQDLRPIIAEGLANDLALADVGLDIATVRVTRVAPTPELEKALQAPTRERLQQTADEATFQRRALAVEKERAIAENELANQIELARREQQLIAERGANERRRVEDEAEAQKIEAIGRAERAKMGSETKAEGIRQIEAAQNQAELERIGIYRDLPIQVLLGLAARELAGKLERIDHLNLSPDGMTGLLQTLMTAGTRKLENAE
ncbi:MAG TPA: SPFH domain-containing protein [Acidimicrobiia bacterium]|jgi:regulator of protease activity HflC (stomatin/prohibitin superfamily)